MFDPLTIHHDECVRQVVEWHEKVPKEKVAAAFLHSLSTRKLHLRSALSSWALTRPFTLHPFASNAGRYTAAENGVAYAMHGDCYVCDSFHIASRESYVDEDLNVLNFERHKWGGEDGYSRQAVQNFFGPWL